MTSARVSREQAPASRKPYWSPMRCDLNSSAAAVANTSAFLRMTGSRSTVRRNSCAPTSGFRSARAERSLSHLAALITCCSGVTAWLVFSARTEIRVASASCLMPVEIETRQNALRMSKLRACPPAEPLTTTAPDSLDDCRMSDSTIWMR